MGEIAREASDLERHMSDRPEWIRLVLDDLERQTALLSPAAFGHFMRLVLCQMKLGALPNDPRALERISPGLKRSWAEIEALFAVRDAGLVHEAFARERDSSLARIAAKRAAGKKGMSSRYGYDYEADPPPTDIDGHGRGRAGGGRRGTASSADSTATNRASQPVGSSVSSSAGSSVSSCGLTESQLQRQNRPSSSSEVCGAGDRGRPPLDATTTTTGFASTALREAIGLLPPELSPAERREAIAILATWPESTLKPELDRLLKLAADRGVPHAYLLACLRRRRDNPPRERERPAVAGRIDPVLARTASDFAAMQAERAEADALLAGLDDATLERLKARVVAAADAKARPFVARGDPRSSRSLRAAMAATLAQGATA